MKEKANEVVTIVRNAKSILTPYGYANYLLEIKSFIDYEIGREQLEFMSEVNRKVCANETN